MKMPQKCRGLSVTLASHKHKGRGRSSTTSARNKKPAAQFLSVLARKRPEAPPGQRFGAEQGKPEAQAGQQASEAGGSHAMPRSPALPSDTLRPEHVPEGEYKRERALLRWTDCTLPIGRGDLRDDCDDHCACTPQSSQEQKRVAPRCAAPSVKLV